jgi:uncharacterized protein
MKRLAAAFVSGLIFALGLGISGMTQPSKVVGFLDFFGHWDPSLACVMIGAIAVYFVAWRLIVRRSAPLFSPRFVLPGRIAIDRPLIAGAAIFGAGWGLGGFCPGPAIASLASGSGTVVLFVLAMVAGMYLHSLIAHPIGTTRAALRVDLAAPAGDS